MDINPQRLLLADGYKNAIRGLIDTQEIFLSVIKNLSSIAKPGTIVPKAIQIMRDTTKQISNVLNTKDNSQLINGLLFQITSKISNDWLGDPKQVKGNAYLLQLMVDNGYIDQTYYDSITSKISRNVKLIFSNIEQGNKSKGLFRDTLKNADWKSLGGGIFDFASSLTPFGGIIKPVGQWLYNAWDKRNEASWNKRAGGFQDNLRSQFGGQTYGMGQASSNPQQPSGPTWNPGLNRFRGPNGQFISAAAGAAGLSHDNLFVFFNQNAYAAGWTKDVLQLLKTIAGTNNNNNGTGGLMGFLKSLMSGIGRLLPLLAQVAAVAGAAFVGWQAGRWLGENVKWGGKTLDQHTQNVESGGFQVWDKLTGKYNFTSKDRQLLDQQRGVANMTPAQMAELNTELRARTVATAKERLASQKKISEIDSTAKSIAILQQILDETKKQNDKKADSSGASGLTANTQRYVHHDIGDTTIQLLNLSVVGQPRK